MYTWRIPFCYGVGNPQSRHRTVTTDNARDTRLRDDKREQAHRETERTNRTGPGVQLLGTGPSPVPHSASDLMVGVSSFPSRRISSIPSALFEGTVGVE